MSKGKKVEITMKPVTDEEIQEMKRSSPGFIFRRPAKGETRLSRVEGCLCLHYDYFKKGLTLPLKPFIADICKYFHMVPAMFTPNTISALSGLYRFFSKYKIDWTITHVMSFFTFVNKEPNIFYAQVRKPNRFGITGNPSSHHSWKDKFVFVKPEDGEWDISIVPKEIDREVFKDWRFAKAVEKVYEAVGCKYILLNVITLEISTAPKEKRTVKEKPLLSAPKKRRLAEHTAGDTEENEEDEEETDQEMETSAASLPLEEETTSPKPKLPTRKSQRVILSSEESEEDNTIKVDHPTSSAKTPPGLEDTPKKKALEETYAFDDEAETLTLKYNNSVSYIPDQMVSSLPIAVISCLENELDRQKMERYTEEDLVNLLAQLSFGTAMLGKYIHDTSCSKEATSAELKSKLTKTESLLKITSNELQSEKEKFQKREEDLLAETAAHEQKVSTLEKAKEIADSSLLSVGIELESLKTEHSFQKEKSKELVNRLGTETDNWKIEKEKLLLQLSNLQKVFDSTSSQLTISETKNAALQKKLEEVPAQSMSAESILEDFRSSDEYILEMKEYGLHGFNLCSKMLLKDGLLDPSDAEKYDYEKGLTREAAGEFM